MKQTPLAVWMATAPLAALAAPQEYTILAVGIHDSQEKAAALAMEYAIKRALFLSATKMGAADIEEKILRLTPQQLATVIRGTTIDKTKRDGKNTYEEIRVTVAEDVLRPLMERAVPAASASAASNPTPEAPAVTRSVLVVPALVTNGHTYVWEKENTLRAPLGSELIRQSRGLVMLPSGDLQDLRLIDPANAATVKSGELATMFERYGVQEIVVAMISPAAEGSEDPTRILLHRVTKTAVRNETMDVPAAAADEKADARMVAAARAIAAASVQIATSTADDDKEKLAKAFKQPVLFTYSTPKELARMTKAIRSAPHVLALEMPSITLRDVKGVVYVEGKDAIAVRAHLTSQGVVVREQGGSWNIAVR